MRGKYQTSLSTALIICLCIYVAKCDDPFDWVTVDTRGQEPRGLAGATMAHVDDYLVIFGGVEEYVNLTMVNGNIVYLNHFSNDIHLFHIPSKTWSTPIITGPKPPARSFHRMVGHDGTHSAYLLGGVIYSDISGVQFGMFDDLWKFSVRTLRWTQLVNQAGYRIDQAMAIVDNDIYVHGGLISFAGTTEEKLLNDMLKYNVLNGQWTTLIPSNWSNPALPPIRYQARFEYNDDDIIVLYGGDVLPDNTQGRYDTWGYYVDENRWELFDNGSMIPLFTGIAAAYGDTFMLATGEMRYGTQVQCVDPVTGKKNNPVNTMYVMDMKTHTYREVNPKFNILPNEQAAYVRVGNKVYKWGGFNFYCVSANIQGGNDHRTITKYDSTLSVTTIPKRLN